jgi:hypothetical protein
MHHYFINNKSNFYDNYIIHNENCKDLPPSILLDYVGMFNTPEEAIADAKKLYVQINGCKFCLPDYYHNYRKYK